MKYADTVPQRKTKADTAGGFSEEEMHARTLRNRAAEEHPPAQVKPVPVGSWGIDSTGELMQLREYRLDDPILTFPEGLPNNQTVHKYMGWMKGGSEPPPLHGLETDKGRVRIQDGRDCRANHKRSPRAPPPSSWT